MNFLRSFALSALALPLSAGLPSHLLAQSNSADALVGVWEGTKLDGRNNQWDLFGPFEIEKDPTGIVVTYLGSRVGDGDHRMHEPTFKASSLRMQWGSWGGWVFEATLVDDSLRGHLRHHGMSGGVHADAVGGANGPRDHRAVCFQGDPQGAAVPKPIHQHPLERGARRGVGNLRRRQEIRSGLQVVRCRFHQRIRISAAATEKNPRKPSKTSSSMCSPTPTIPTPTTASGRAT